jgi:hypothetical protein
MRALALLLAARVLVVDDRAVVPAGEWRALELGLQQRVGVVECSFQVVSRGGRVRFMLMTMRDLRNLRDGKRHTVLDATPYAASGSFSYRVPSPGDYVIVMDNRFDGRGPAELRLKVSVDYTDEVAVTPRYAPQSTRTTVIALSTLFFLAVCTYFARRFAG